MLNNIVNASNAAVARYINTKGKFISACAIGLDPQAGLLWICNDAIVTTNSQRFDQFGGVSAVERTQVGNYVIYPATDSTIQALILRWRQKRKQAA